MLALAFVSLPCRRPRPVHTMPVLQVGEATVVQAVMGVMVGPVALADQVAYLVLVDTRVQVEQGAMEA